MNPIITKFSPVAFNHHLKYTSTHYSYYKTDAGLLKLYHTDDQGIYKVEFCDEKSSDISIISSTIKLLLVGTDFQIAVWNATLQILTGKTATYQEIAHQIDKPNAWRAVANALANNRIAHFIPCHRVMRKNGMLGGYKWGIERKQQLLKAETLQKF